MTEKHYPITFLNMLGKEIVALINRCNTEYSKLLNCKRNIAVATEEDVMNTIGEAMNSAIAARGTLNSCTPCLREWDKSKDISKMYGEALSALQAHYSELRELADNIWDTSESVHTMMLESRK